MDLLVAGGVRLQRLHCLGLAPVARLTLVRHAARPRGPVPGHRRSLPARYPENLDHHFVVDPTKFDFYAMDCYRQLAEDKMAETLAEEVIRKSTDFDGTERAPMRTAEARVTLGVIAAREGDIEQAVHQGERALSGPRKSLPTLAMVSRDLARILKDRYPSEQATESYLDHVRTIVGTSNLPRRLTE